MNKILDRRCVCNININNIEMYVNKCIESYCSSFLSTRYKFDIAEVQFVDQCDNWGRKLFRCYLIEMKK